MDRMMRHFACARRLTLGCDRCGRRSALDHALEWVWPLWRSATPAARRSARSPASPPTTGRRGPSNRKRSICRGRTGARTVGYMAAFSAMRCNPVVRAFAERLKAQGKPHKVVVVACIRKLFTILNALLKRGEKWNPDRFAIPT